MQRPRRVNLSEHRVSFLVAMPLIVLGVLLLWRPWHPVLDMAMTELRVRDVGGRHTPLIGLPGRIGVFPDQGSHPGPWSFYLLAPGYRLVGGAANGLRLGSVIINSVVIVATVAIARRVGGRWAGIGIAVALALAVRGYGLDVLGQPWNPYFSVLIWILILVATWGVLEGHARLAPVVVGAATIAAQTHLPYVVVGTTAVAIAAFGAFRQARRSPAEASHWVRWGAIAFGTGVVMWLPPIVDQIRHRPGNLTMLYREFFGATADTPIRFGEAVVIWLRHFDLPAVLVDLFTHRAAFVTRSGLESGGVGGALGGVATLVVWAAAAVWAFRNRRQPGVGRWWNLHAMLAFVAVAELYSISNIHGKPWFYLTLWAWGTTLLVGVATTATLGLAFARSGVAVNRHAVVAKLAVVIGGVTLAGFSMVSTVAAFSTRPPESYLSDELGAVVPNTVTALANGDGDAVGRDGRYVVFWQDAANNGSQGYGLLDDLERNGFTVGVHPTWRVPATPHRVMPDGTYDAEVHLVTGGFIDEWRQHRDYVEVAYADQRTPDERARFDALRTEVIGRLEETGHSNLVPVVDSNLFGASLTPDLPRDIVDDLSEMLLIPPPVAVFIAPAGSTS